MRLTIESTTKIVNIDGVECRVWEGQTVDGIPVHCFVTRVAVSAEAPDAVHDKFCRELRECRVPSPVVEALPGRMTL